MTPFGFNPLTILRRRLGAVFGTFAVSAACCLGGALMAFLFAPGQALQAYRISRLPVMDAAAVEAAAAGDEILITGVLAGNAPLLDGFSFVTYSVEEWEVTVPSSDDDGGAEPHGTWKSVETVVPELILDLSGQPVPTRAASRVRLSGPLHEKIVNGDSASQARYEGQLLPDGTRRYRGLTEGDLTTVLGKKAAAGGVIPEHLFAGDRVAFETSQRQAASGLLFSGICMMILSPVVLVGGLLGAAFWQRR